MKKLIWLDYPSRNMRLLPTRQLVLLIILTATCAGIQLVPRPPNVEFTSLVVFLVGSVFGASFGAMLGSLVMLINGLFSPYGFAGLMLPFQVTGMVMVGIVGGLYRRTRHGLYDSSSCIETAVLGAFLALAYDMITNFGVAVSFMLLGMPVFSAFVSAIVSGAPFSLIHIISNTFVFGLIFFPLTDTLQKLLGGDKIWKKKALRT